MQTEEKSCSVCGGSLCKACSVVAVIAGVLFLLQDLAVWNFWNISWYTVAFLMVGGFCLLNNHKGQ